ncbi:MAG: methyl-accepting chemotaxis protein, partial [Chloroflexi bacterium]|nr:methyl-accepting chemotaxis protein [Chloroflexota bacterium]
MKLNLAAKFIGAFGVLVVLGVGYGLFALYQMSVLYSSTNYIATNVVPGSIIINSLDTEMEHYRQAQLKHVLTTSATDRAKIEADLADTEARFAQVLKNYEPIVTNRDERELMNKTEAQWQQYIRQSQSFLAASRAGDHAKAIAVLDGDARPTFDALDDTLVNWRTFNTDSRSKSLREAQESYTAMQMTMIGVIVMAVVVAVSVAFLLSRFVTQIVTQYVSFASRVAEGDLTTRLAPKSHDELGALGEHLNSMVQNLNRLSRQIRENTQNITAATAEILATVSEHTASANQQSAAVNQTTATVEEIRSAADQSARQAGD